MYALKKLWLRLSLGRGPRLPPQLAHRVRVRMGLVLSGSLRGDSGLCVIAKDGLDWRNDDRATVGDWLDHQFKLWPNSTDSVSFPVPHPTLSPQDAYYQCDMWAGEYGAMRLNLAKHLLDAATRNLGIKP